MKQETRETTDAIIEDDNRLISDIINENKHKKDPYWIVLFAKPSKTCIEGKPTLMKHIKAYPIKPSPQVGMIIGEINNIEGTIKWDVNMPQRPFDFDALQQFGAKSCDEVVTETTTIADAYITK